MSQYQCVKINIDTLRRMLSEYRLELARGRNESVKNLSRLVPAWLLSLGPCIFLVPYSLCLAPCSLCLVPCALYLVPCTLYVVPSTKCMLLKYLLYSRQLTLSIHPFHYHADSFADIIIEKSEHHLSIGLVG